MGEPATGGQGTAPPAPARTMPCWQVREREGGERGSEEGGNYAGALVRAWCARTCARTCVRVYTNMCACKLLHTCARTRARTLTRTNRLFRGLQSRAHNAVMPDPPPGPASRIYQQQLVEVHRLNMFITFTQSVQVHRFQLFQMHPEIYPCCDAGDPPPSPARSWSH